MEQNYSNPQQQQFIPQQTLPYATSVLILGILSIVICWCYGIIGVVLAIIGLVQARKAGEAYSSNPGIYTLSSYNNMKAGKVCAIIGLIISSLMLLYMIFWIFIFGAALTSMPWHELKGLEYY